MKSENHKKKEASGKNYEFEKWAIENIHQFWIMQDEYINNKSIELYEELYKKFKDKNLKALTKEGLELLYAERREIRSRKDHMLRQASQGILKWN